MLHTTMADEVKIQIEAVPTDKDPSQASSSSSETERAATETERPASGTPAAQLQDETSTVGNEQRGTAEGERDIQLGALVAILSFTVMLPGLSFSSAVAKGPENWRLDILMLFAFASCICGLSFMLLSMQLLGAPEIRASHRIISRCLFYACIALPTLTLLSLLLVMPFKFFLYVGLVVPPLVVVAVAVVHWYVKSRSEGTTRPDITAELKEQGKEMEANSKITGALMASSFGGLVGTLSALDKQSGDTGGDTTLRGTHVAIMFMFSTAVTSVLLMVLSMVALKIESRVHRRSMVGAIRHANVILLGLLAAAAFSAAFVVLRFYMLTAFVSLALAAAVQFIIEHCTTAEVDANVPVEGRQDGSNDGVHSDPDPDPIQETQLRWMADIAKQVTAWSLGGVMVIFGRFIGDSDENHGKAAANKTCMFLLSSAFASGLGLMFLMNFGSGGRPARGGVINAASNILAYSALGTIAAAALAIYGVVVMKS